MWEKVVKNLSFEKYSFTLSYLRTSGQFMCEVDVMIVGLSDEEDAFKNNAMNSFYLRSKQKSLLSYVISDWVDNDATVAMPSVTGLLVLFVPEDSFLWLWLSCMFADIIWVRRLAWW